MSFTCEDCVFFSKRYFHDVDAVEGTEQKKITPVCTVDSRRVKIIFNPNEITMCGHFVENKNEVGRYMIDLKGVARASIQVRGMDLRDAMNRAKRQVSDEDWKVSEIVAEGGRINERGVYTGDPI